jgi:hypothetical protein
MLSVSQAFSTLVTLCYTCIAALQSLTPLQQGRVDIHRSNVKNALCPRTWMWRALENTEIGVTSCVTWRLHVYELITGSICEGAGTLPAF